MKKIYLPKLKKIDIIKYSLYLKEPSFSFFFKDGVSAIVGANGIGKTTFVNIIIYCLVGYKKNETKKKKKDEYIDTDFFSSRMNDKYEENEAAEAYLEFSVNCTRFRIGRSLFFNKITFLEVNENRIANVTEEIYREYITEASQINSFNDFEKLIRNFLFFDELRANIAWEADMQDEILRILLFDEEYFTKFKELEQGVTEWDSKGRHKSEDRRMAVQALKELTNEKEKVIKNLKSNEEDSIESENDLGKLFEKKNNIEDEITELQVELKDYYSDLKTKQQTLNVHIGERNNTSLSIEKLSEQIQRLENKLFTSKLETLPDFYYTLEKALTSNGECLVCNAKNKKIKEDAIKKSNEKKCLICSSTLENEEELDPKIIDNINSLNKNRNELITIFENKDKKVRVLSLEIESLQSEMKVLENKINARIREKVYIESLISKDNIEKKPDTYTEIVKSRTNTIDKLNEEIEFAYRKRDQLNDELKVLNNKFKGTITKINNSLSGYFNKYASTFIGLECELTVFQRMIKKIPHYIYLPRINGDIRKNIWAVSESQRFFLDQAFRMAIIDYLQNTIDGFETYFITETPEGSLDIAYEAQVAKMFIKFASSNNNIIFTSNLNSSNFLKVLFSGITKENRNERILNLINKGNMTEVQVANKPQLQKLLNEITGGL